MVRFVVPASDGEESPCHALTVSVRTRMTDTDERTSAFLKAADHLEGWADRLPRWSDDGRETWYEFLDRRYEAEVALVEQLQRAPDCRIAACPMRMHITLILADIKVRTDQGLETALREWARQAREQAGQ